MKPGSLKRLFPVLTIILWSGCASVGPPLPPSLELPAPVKDLRALRKGGQVYLAWSAPEKTTDQETIRHRGPTSICRSRTSDMQACGTPVGQVAPAAAISTGTSHPAGITESYVDPLPLVPGVRPQDEITYAVEVLNDRNRGDGLSNRVQVPLWPATPPPQDFQAQITAQGVKITWACPASPPPPADDIGYRLRIYRRLEGSQTEEKIAGTNLLDCQTPVLDDSFQWEKPYDYRAAVVTIVSRPGKPALEIEGDDTPSVRLFAHDTFPPAVPTDVQAVFSGPGQKPFVDVVWSPGTSADLAGYNVYRHEEGGQPEKLNAVPVKTPAYRDVAVQSGKKYFYSVTAVDVRSNESAKSEEASESVP